MTSSRNNWIFLALLLLGFSSVNARPDGGVMRLRETQGPFVVTIFTAGDIVQDRTTEICVMVQQRDSNETVLDATVDLVFNAPVNEPAPATSDEQVCGTAMAGLSSRVSESNLTRFTARPSRNLSSNKLLYAVPVKFGVAGNWRWEAIIREGANDVNVVCDVPVGPAAHGSIKLVPYMILPVLAVALFVLNQRLRRQLPREPALQTTSTQKTGAF